MPEHPQRSKEPAHDILAAEEFAVPWVDPELHHHGPVTLPDDPTGIVEPHDVLAAEEFALPAPHYGSHAPGLARRSARRRRIGAVLLAVGLLLARRRARRR